MEISNIIKIDWFVRRGGNEVGGRQMPMLWRNLLPSSSQWRGREQVPVCIYHSTQCHISYDVILVFAAKTHTWYYYVRTSTALILWTVVMARGEYTVQEVEAAKQAGRDSSYRTCVLTMFIFLVLCIILLVIAWTTWKPTREKEVYSHHSVSQRKYNVFIIIHIHQILPTICIKL